MLLLHQALLGLPRMLAGSWLGIMNQLWAHGPTCWQQKTCPPLSTFYAICQCCRRRYSPAILVLRDALWVR